jgi:hypothetical protein
MNDKSAIDAAIRSDAGVWFEMCGKIFGKKRSDGLISPKQNYLQTKIQAVVNHFEELNLPVRIIGLKPRQKGSTTYFGALDYHHMRRRSASACVIGGQYSQTTALWDMLQLYNANDRFQWGNTGNINDSYGEWTNGSKLTAETAKDSLAGISATFQVLHCTEVARWAEYGVSDAATVLTNIMKCVPLEAETMIILESTAAGATGSYHDRFVRAVDSSDFLSGAVKIKAGDFVRVFAPWFEFSDSAIRLTPLQRDEMIRTLDDDIEYEGEKELIAKYGVKGDDGVLRLGTTVKDFDVYEQLAWRRYAIHEECDEEKDIFDRDYPHSWQDAFQKSGEPRFNKKGVAEMRKRMKNRAPMFGVLEGPPDGRPIFRQTDPNEAQFIMYERPTPGRRYLESIDPMTGASQTAGADPDYHGVFVLRDGYWDGEGKWNRVGAVARIIPCRWDIDVLAEASWKLAKYFGDSSGCKIVIEMNQDRGITELLKDKNADLYQREIYNQREFKMSKAYGYLTMEKSRETWVECLAKAIREWDHPGDGIDIFDEHAIVQCENFVRKDSGRSEAAEKFHDDDISSIAIGLLLIEHATTFFPNRGADGLPPDLAGIVRPAGSAPSAYS